MCVRHRLSKLLLRHGLMWERRAWTGEHDRWLRGMRFEGPLAVCFDECYGAVLQAKARRDRLDEAIGDVASTPAYVETVARLRCLRGVSTLTALALTVELGDWRRFEPASLGAFLGLVPSESSSEASGGVRADHEDGQQPRPAAAGRSRLAPAQTTAPERHAQRPPGGPTSGRPCRSQSDRPRAAPALAAHRAARQTTHDRRGRGRARTRGALLEAGDDAVTLPAKTKARRAHRQHTRGATRDATTSNPLGDARL
jgi:hypothetical protein